MRGLERGDVVLDQTAEPDDFDRVSAKGVLVMVAQGHKQESAGQENDDHDTDSCSREQFEVKMPLTKKPIADPAEDRPSAAF